MEPPDEETIERWLREAEHREPARAPGRASSWEPVNLGPILRGEAPEDPPTVWRRSDGVALLYAGKVNAINAETESGKTWMALHACAQQMHLGEHVYFVDFEDSAGSVVSRLVSLRVPVDVVELCFHYIRPEEPLTDVAMEKLSAALAEHQPTLIVLDGVTEAMVLNGWSITSNDDAAKYMMGIVRPLQASGAAILQLDHVTKSSEDRGRWAIGAQHKLAGIDGAVYSARRTQDYGRGRRGSSSLSVAKDRPGHIRSAVSDSGGVGEFVLAPLVEGEVTAEVVAPGTVSQDSIAYVSEELLMSVSDVLAASPEPMSQTAVEENVTGNSIKIRLALDWLVETGHVTEASGPRRARMCTLVKPYAGAES